MLEFHADIARTGTSLVGYTLQPSIVPFPMTDIVSCSCLARVLRARGILRDSASALLA